MLAKTTISHLSILQLIIALSINEAEYIALCEAGKNQSC